MSVLYVTVTGDLPGAGAGPEPALAVFTPAGWVPDPAAGMLFPPSPVQARIFGGTFSVALLATDTTGTPWTWLARFTGIADVTPYSFSFALPSNAASFTATSAAPCVFTAGGTAYANGQPLTLAGSSLPAGFTAGTVYYVTGVSGTSFSLAATSGGTALPSTSTGSGSVVPVVDISALAQVPSLPPTNQYLPLTTGTPGAGQVPAFTGVGYNTAPASIAGTGTVTTVSVASANGLAGTVANPTTAPAITLETTVTGILKGNGTAVSAAAAGTDYLTPTGNGSQLTGITASQAGADASGAAAAVLASSLQKSANLSDLANAATARTNLGLGSAATHAATDFDAAGAAAAAQAAAIAASLPSTDDLSAIATANATAASVPMNSHKFTGLANGSAGTDSAAFGQTPAGGNTATIGQGGTGQVTQQAALDALAGAVTSGQVLRGNGTHVTLSALQSGDIPNNAANTSGTAANLSGTPPLPNGTTATTQSAADSSTKLATTAYADTSSSAAAAGKVSRSGDTMAGYLAPHVGTLTDGSSVAIDVSTGNDFRWTLGGSSHTLATPSNPVNGQSITIAIKYSGSFTPLFTSAVYDFGAAGQPSWSATNGKTDYVGFRYDSALNAAAGAWAYMGSVLGLTS